MDFNKTAYKKFKVISAVFTEVIMNTIEVKSYINWIIMAWYSF